MVNPQWIAAQRAFAAQQAARQAGVQRGLSVSPAMVAQANRAQIRQQVQTQQRQQAAQRVGSTEFFQAAIDRQQGGGGRQEEDGGFFGNIINNPIVSTLLKPLEVLDYGRRATILGIEELAGALPEPLEFLAPITLGIDEDRTDTRSNWDKLTDPTYGYGQVMGKSGNEWLDRIVGFGGDVVLDPLTYLSLGTAKIPGAAGRLNLALKAEKVGLPREIIEQIGVRGGRAVTDVAQREALGLTRPGLTFAGGRIPGTGRLAEGVGGALGQVRAPLIDTAVGRTIRKWGVSRDPELRQHIERIVAGTPGPGNAPLGVIESAKQVGGTYAKRIGRRETESIFSRQATEIGDEFGDDAAITHLMETDPTNPTVAKWREMNDAVYDWQTAPEQGVSVGKRDSWVPRLLNPFGEEVFDLPTTNIPGGRAAGAPGTQQYSRVIVPGKTYTIKGKQFTPVTGTLKEINDWSVRELGQKLYHDSPTYLAAAAVEQAAKSVGDVAYQRYLMQGANRTVGSLTDPAFSHLERDVDLSKAAGERAAAAMEPEAAMMATQGMAQRGGAERIAGRLIPHLKQVTDDAMVAAKTAQSEARAAFKAATGEVADFEQARRGVFETAEQAVPEAERRAAWADLDVATAPVGDAQQRAFADQLELQAQAREAGVRPPAQPVAQEPQDLERLALPPGARPGTADYFTQLPTEDLPPAVREQLAGLGPDSSARAAAAKVHMDHTAQQVKATAARQGKLGKLNNTPTNSYEELGEDLTYVAGNPATFDPTTRRLLDRYGKIVAAMGEVDASEALAAQTMKDLRSGKLTDEFIRVANDGFERMSTDRLMGRDTFMSTAMREARDRFQAAVQVEPGLFAKAMDSYVRFFKNWATATPGFHIRNAISAVFMNLTEGVTFREMIDGNKIWQAFRKDPMGDWVSTLPTHLQANARDVVRATLGSGAGGRFSAAELGRRAFGDTKQASRLIENRWTRKSQAIGERVEGGVRSGLALRALNEGGDINDAVGRLKRVHFDYSDVNETDQALRRYIPFWTFMSRNLPLQIQQQWLKPRTYAHYNSFRRNFNIDPQGEMFMPEYMEEEGAFFVSPGLGLAPQVGATELEEQLKMFSNPARLASQLNPLIKVPIELMTNRDLYYGSNYRENDFQKLGLEMALPGLLGSAVGLAESTPEGLVAERKYSNAAYDLIPFLAQINRLGSTTAGREGKGWQSLANYFGVPIRMVSPEEERKQILYQRRQSGRASPDEARRQALATFGA